MDYAGAGGRHEVPVRAAAGRVAGAPGLAPGRRRRAGRLRRRTAGSYLPSRGGQVHLRSLLLTLEPHRSRRGRPTAARRWRGRIDLLKRRGLLIVISDLYDETRERRAALKRAAHIGHEVIVFHVLTRDEVELPFRDDVELEDPETGRARAVERRRGGRGVPRGDQRVPRALARAARPTASTTSACSPTRRSTPALRAYLRRRALGAAA